MAARFGATIVPFGGVGLDDGFEMLLSPQEIRGIPVLGKWLEENAKKKIPPARRFVYATSYLTSHLRDVVEAVRAQLASHPANLQQSTPCPECMFMCTYS